MSFRMVYKCKHIFLPFCHKAHVWQTDRRTEFSLLHRICIPCSAVKTNFNIPSCILHWNYTIFVLHVRSNIAKVIIDMLNSIDVWLALTLVTLNDLKHFYIYVTTFLHKTYCEWWQIRSWTNRRQPADFCLAPQLPTVTVRKHYFLSDLHSSQWHICCNLQYMWITL